MIPFKIGIYGSKYALGTLTNCEVWQSILIDN